MDDDTAVESLRAELRALREEVQSLRAEVATAKQAPSMSMREHTRCPRCLATELLHVQRVYEHQLGDFMKLHAKGIFGGQPVGTFEVYVCRRCELAEWYVAGAGALDPATLSRTNRDYVRVVDGTPPEGGPFR